MPKRPRDPNQLAKLIVDLATSDSVDIVSEKKRNPPTRGRAGGLKGGKARASALSKKRRSDIAKKAANSRWKNC